jgi:hypothetical protein
MSAVRDVRSSHPDWQFTRVTANSRTALGAAPLDRVRSNVVPLN